MGPGGWGRGGYLSLSEGVPGTSVLGGCLGGHVFVGTVVNTTHTDWNQTNATRPCVMLALNPNNADHWIYTHPPMTYQTVDGGKSYESLNHSGIFHCGIDRVGNLYTAAMEGFSISRDCGPGKREGALCSHTREREREREREKQRQRERKESTGGWCSSTNPLASWWKGRSTP